MWKRISFLIISIFISFYVKGQLSERDSAFYKIVDPYVWPAWNGEIESEKFLDTLAEKQLQYDSPFTKGMLAYINGKYWDGIDVEDKALSFFSEASQILGACCDFTKEFMESEIGIGFVSIHSGLINFDTLHFQKGYKYVEEGYERARKYNFTGTAHRMLDFIGDYHFYSAYRIEDFDMALKFYEQLERELEGSPDSTYRFIGSKLNLANVHRSLGNQILSDEYFEQAVELGDKYRHYSILYGAYSGKAAEADNLGNHQNALKFKLNAAEFAHKSGDNELINRSNRQLYFTYNNLGDYKNALKFLELHYEGVREMNKAEALQLQAKLESQKELDQQVLEIKSLENKNLNTSRNFLTALTMLSLATLGFVFWAYARLKKNNKKLTQKNEEIILAQMKGQNIERKRMAGELHDNLNTKIAAVRYRLEAQLLNADEEQSKMIGGTVELVNDIYEDIRLISHNLIPETVEEIGLIPSLEKLVNSLNENDSTKFHLVSQIKNGEHLRQMSYELYNIIFEMINNILKHASADNAWISISDYDNKLNVTVKDDGKGFEVDQNMGGFGLKSINSRIEKLDGRYKVESSVGSGTNYIIEVPI